MCIKNITIEKPINMSRTTHIAQSTPRKHPLYTHNTHLTCFFVWFLFIFRMMCLVCTLLYTCSTGNNDPAKCISNVRDHNTNGDTNYHQHVFVPIYALPVYIYVKSINKFNSFSRLKYWFLFAQIPVYRTRLTTTTTTMPNTHTYS